MATDTRTYYEILDVSRTATTDEIERQFRRLMKKHHPDVFTKLRARYHDDPEILEVIERQAQESQEEAKRINESHDILSDQNKRCDYDAKLANAPGKGASTSQAKPADIRVSKTVLDFGSLARGEKKSDSFVISNLGGPATNYEVGWKTPLDWAEAEAVTDPTHVFPIKVTVTVDTEQASAGRNTGEIMVVVDGTVWVTVTVLATIVIPAPQPRPAYVPPTPPPPKYTPTPPKSPIPPTPTVKPPSTPIIVAIVIGVVLLACWLFTTTFSNVDDKISGGLLNVSTTTGPKYGYTYFDASLTNNSVMGKYGYFTVKLRFPDGSTCTNVNDSELAQIAIWIPPGTTTKKVSFWCQPGGLFHPPQSQADLSPTKVELASCTLTLGTEWRIGSYGNNQSVTSTKPCANSP